MIDIPAGRVPGMAALHIRITETLTHGWDLARATGQTPRYDDEVVAAGMAFATGQLGGNRPPGGPFKPPVTAPDDAPPIDRLAAYLGRQV